MPHWNKQKQNTENAAQRNKITSIIRCSQGPNVTGAPSISASTRLMQLLVNLPPFHWTLLMGSKHKSRSCDFKKRSSFANFLRTVHLPQTFHFFVIALDVVIANSPCVAVVTDLSPFAQLIHVQSEFSQPAQLVVVTENVIRGQLEHSQFSLVIKFAQQRASTSWYRARLTKYEWLCRFLCGMHKQTPDISVQTAADCDSAKSRVMLNIT